MYWSKQINNWKSIVKKIGSGFISGFLEGWRENPQ